MKVVVLCGGLGSRIAGTGHDVPKPMIPIGERPIIWHILRGFAHWGFRDFVLCLGHRAELFKQYFLALPLMLGDVRVDRDGARTCGGEAEIPDWTITLAETGVDSMTGHRVRRAGLYLPAEDECFAVTYGDGVSDIDFRRVVAFHREHGKLATVTAVHPPGRFGELALDSSGQVGEFNEKPQASAGWISGGFFVFSRRVLDLLPPDRSLVLEEEPLRRLARDGQLMAYRHEGFWYCMDTPRDLRQLSDLWGSGQAPWAVWR
jgi:glucose-1-phosphate cytidylyltransferase